MTVALDCAPALDFEVPAANVARVPPEERGIERDAVRMLVASPDGLQHARAYDLPDVLRPGDLLVTNTSMTIPAALPGTTSSGESAVVHLSTVVPGSDTTTAEALAARSSQWVVEVRSPAGFGSGRSAVHRFGERVTLPGGGVLDVDVPYRRGEGPPRLWSARLRTPETLQQWLAVHGRPIRYGYAAGNHPIEAYRTAYADTPGSAEMPSAGRPLTLRLLGRLRCRGIGVAPLVLHTGVSSLEYGEPPYPEWFSVPAATASAVAATRGAGGRVVAVGTTVVRALESAAGQAGRVHPRTGWTDLVVTPERGVAAVNGLLTGWHEPRASHLLMLEAVAGCRLLQESYRAALEAGYLWHEFGDLHLLLGRG